MIFCAFYNVFLIKIPCKWRLAIVLQSSPGITWTSFHANAHRALPVLTAAMAVSKFEFTLSNKHFNGFSFFIFETSP